MGMTLSEPEIATEPTVERDAEAAFVEDQLRSELYPSEMIGEFALMLHDGVVLTPPPPAPYPGELNEMVGRLR